MTTQASTAQATGVSVLGRASIATVGSHGRAVVTKVFQRFLWVGKRALHTWGGGERDTPVRPGWVV